MIEGYSLNTIGGRTTGNMTREDIVVTYYYDKKEMPKQEEQNTPNGSQENQNPSQEGTQNNTNQEQTGNETTPNVVIKPSGDTNKKEEIIKTGDVGPSVYISIIAIVVLANITQITFTNKKTRC